MRLMKKISFLALLFVFGLISIDLYLQSSIKKRFDLGKYFLDHYYWIIIIIMIIGINIILFLLDYQNKKRIIEILGKTNDVSHDSEIARVLDKAKWQIRITLRGLMKGGKIPGKIFIIRGKFLFITREYGKKLSEIYAEKGSLKSQAKTLRLSKEELIIFTDILLKKKLLKQVEVVGFSTNQKGDLSVVCKNCNYLVTEEDRICPRCDAPVRECGNCGFGISLSDKKCPECKKKTLPIVKKIIPKNELSTEGIRRSGGGRRRKKHGKKR